MWNKIIKTCENSLDRFPDCYQEDKWPPLVSTLMMKLSPYYEAHSLKQSQTNDNLPYGRYLLHNDVQKRFHIEMHIFSNNYQGEIHCHETWGIFWLISGALFIEDFLYSQSEVEQQKRQANEQAQLVRSSMVRRGSACAFHPPESDWHRVRTIDGVKEQTISLHIYGLGYDLECGKYLNEQYEMIEGRRGGFKDNSLFEPVIIEESQS